MPTGSALRAGALALAPTLTGRRAGGGPRLAWRPARAPLHSRGRSGCPGPVLAGFTRIYTYALHRHNAADEEADRPSKKPTPLPQRRRPHANQIKGRSRLIVRPAARTRVTARTPHRGRAAARRRSRCRARECTGRHTALLLSSMPSFLCSLCTKQAEQGSKTLCVFNAMPFA